jgi:hypothetical protein
MDIKKWRDKKEENSQENESAFKNIWANFLVSIHLQQKRGGNELNNTPSENIDLVQKLENW